MAAAATSPLPEPETLFPSSLSRRSLAQWSYVAVGLGLVAALGAMARGTSDPKLAKGKLGAVATASPEASAAALEILERGGNAADALVAASFAVSVTRPQSTGLGGGGFAVFFNQARREAAALDFRETAPLGASREMYKSPAESRDGPRAAGVPGLVRGLAEIHQEFGSGRLSFAELVEPAIRLARDGFKVDAGLAWASAACAEELKKWPAAAAVFLPGGEPLKAGQRLVQPELAATLERIAKDGADDFYKGETARRIAAAMTKDGGLIRAADLAGYKALEREPIWGRYRDRQIITMPPPAGGVHLLQILNIMERFELAKMGRWSADHLHVLAEAMKRAYADRAAHSGDPAFSKVPSVWLVSKDYAAKLAGEIDLKKASKSDDIRAGVPSKEHDQTTHISIIDAWGNAASSTQTVNTLLGAKYIASGTGFLMNNEMDDFAQRTGVANAFGATATSEANLIEPGKRPLSSMSPSIVLDDWGRLEMVVGTPGGTKIITSVLQVISHKIDFQASPRDSVFAPRVHHQWRFPEELQFEGGSLTPALKAELESRGQGVIESRGGFCDVQAVFRDPRTGQLTAVSDRRGSGLPAAR